MQSASDTQAQSHKSVALCACNSMTRSNAAAHTGSMQQHALASCTSSKFNSGSTRPCSPHRYLGPCVQCHRGLQLHLLPCSGGPAVGCAAPSPAARHCVCRQSIATSCASAHSQWQARTCAKSASAGARIAASTAALRTASIGNAIAFTASIADIVPVHDVPRVATGIFACELCERPAAHVHTAMPPQSASRPSRNAGCAYNGHRTWRAPSRDVVSSQNWLLKPNRKTERMHAYMISNDMRKRAGPPYDRKRLHACLPV